MKKLTVFIGLIAALSAHQPIDRTELDAKFSKVAQEREVMPVQEIRSISSPFLQNTGESQSIMLQLQAIVQNRAKLNGIWYKIGDELGGGFSIVRISRGVVGISDMNTYSELNLKDNKNVTIFKK